MIPEISGLKSLRASLNVTQLCVSKALGISQSYIAKIESGRADPPYSVAKKLFDYLSELKSKEKSRLLLARDIMTRCIKHLSSIDKLSKALKLMDELDISQLPVIDDGRVVGSVTQKVIPKLLASGKKDIELLSVNEVMEDAFPVISEDSLVSTVSGLLQANHAVLLSKKGKITGIITSHDLYKAL